MEIKRDAYLQQLIERKDNGMIKVITGIRRCGKSFLLFTIFKRYLLENGVDVDHIIEIALDGIENEELRDPKVCFKYIKDAMKDDGKYYLLLDEVQFMPRFEEVLNSLLRMSNIDVYVTGSNSKFLSSDIVTEFRGRGDEIRIYPLSFAEFYSVYDGDYDDAWDDYMIYGGLPQIVSFQSERQKADYLKNIFANVYLKDVIERNKIQNVDEIGILVDVLASAIGAPTNPSKIANTFASERQMTYANKTISKHIDHLTDAFLISKASRYDIKSWKPPLMMRTKPSPHAWAGLMASSTRKPTAMPMTMHSSAASTLVMELLRLLWESFFLFIYLLSFPCLRAPAM